MIQASVAELADALDLGSSGINPEQVRPLSLALFGGDMSRDDDVFDDGEIHWGGDHESRYSWESSDEGSSGNDNRDVFDDGKIRWGGDHD